jgi:hypothetical protein
MGVDIAIAAGLAILTIAMAYLGVHVTLHPADSPRSRFWYKVGFSACAVAAVGLVIWQGVRNGRAQSAFKADIADMKRDSKRARDDVQEARQDLKNESIRRQQAERDLALTVQGIPKATREGVAEDIKKSPIKVEVKGGVAESAPLQTEDVRILQTVVRSTHADAPYAAQWIIQANVPVTPSLRRLITCNVPIKYIEFRPSSGGMTFLGGDKDPIRIFENDNTKILINVLGQPGIPIIVPEQSIIIHVHSAVGPILIKSIEVGPR